MVGTKANAASPAVAATPISSRRVTVACAAGSRGAALAPSVVPPPVKKSTSDSDSQLLREPLPAGRFMFPNEECACTEEGAVMCA